MPKAHDSDIAQVDGSNSWSGGVNSILNPTISTPSNPDGLKRNQLAWLSNATVRDGGITTRAGWNRLGRIHDGSALYQGGSVYEPNGANPYLMLSIGGHIYKVLPDDLGSIVDLSASFGLFNPPLVEQAFFCQAELFEIIQAGDYETAAVPTLPLFWDGTTLRRSIGITTLTPTHTPGQNEIPAATCMDYYQLRLWYAQNRQYAAGDIVGGPSGTAPYHFKDAVLNVTENPLAFGGDGFTVPTNAGNIRALKHAANLDSTLGQGRLYIFTRKAVYALTVPMTRLEWIAADKDHMPVQTVVQLVNGSVNDRGVVSVNGDLYYQSLEPGIRSLVTAIRYFGQPGNTQIGVNENRILKFNDRALLHACTGIEFDNRLLMSALPRQTEQGIVHPALVPLDFAPLSTFESTLPPVWHGMYEGLEHFQLFTADFGGLQRAFSVVRASDGGIDLWELTTAERFNDGDKRTTSYIEFPAFNWGDNFELKELIGAELWVDRLFGEVVFKMEYRPDGDPCWYFWHEWKKCSSRDSCEDIPPICYPLTPRGESYQPGMTLPRPPVVCAPVTKRPTNVAFQIQPRLTVHGFCRVRGLYLYSTNKMRALYYGITC